MLKDDEEFLKQVHIAEDKNENLQSITGKSDTTLPVLKEEQGERDEFIREVTSDETLQTIRDWANKRERGYYWSNGILKHHSIDHTGLPLDRLVIPKTRRSKVMKMARDHMGHLGYK